MKQYDSLKIKKGEYQIVGSPTITDDGIASGFSSANYLYTNKFSFGSSSWEIITAFTFTSSSSANRTLYAGKSANASAPLLYVRTNQFSCYVPSAVGTWGYTKAGVSHTFTTNTKYWIKFGYNSTNSHYYAKISTDGVNYTTKFDEADDTVLLGGSGSFDLSLGYNKGYNLNPFDNGSIDLNAFKIYVNGSLIFGYQTYDIENFEAIQDTQSYIIDVAQFVPKLLQDSDWIMSIIDCFQVLLSTEHSTFQSLKQIYYDLIYKTRNYNLLSTDAKLKIVRELGFGYIIDTGDLEDSQVSDLLIFLNLIYTLKGKKEGLLLCLNFLGFEGNVTYTPWEEQTDPTKRIPFTASLDITSSYFTTHPQAAEKLVTFLRSYMLPLITVYTTTIEHLTDFYVYVNGGLVTGKNDTIETQVIDSINRSTTATLPTSYLNSPVSTGSNITLWLAPLLDSDDIIVAETDPISSTVGKLGQLYRNSILLKTYECTAINNSSYTWTLRSPSIGFNKAIISDFSPTTSTKCSSVGDIYYDMYAHSIYKCTAISSGVYTWTSLSIDDFISQNTQSSPLSMEQGQPCFYTCKYSVGNQYITYTTSSGFVLKSGSTLTYCQGLNNNKIEEYPKYKSITISSDSSSVTVPTSKYLFYNNGSIECYTYNTDFIVSENEPTLSGTKIWYNPLTNILKKSISGANWNDVSNTISLPFAKTSGTTVQVLSSIPYVTKLRTIETNSVTTYSPILRKDVPQF